MIEIIAVGLLNLAKSANYQKKLVVTSSKPSPQQCQNGLIIERADLKTTHEEADVIIPMQVLAAIDDGREDIAICCDDTDVFVLVSYLYHRESWESNVFIKGFSKDAELISIQKTVDKHREIMPSLPACHILSGVDTVPQMFRIGKKKALTAVKQTSLVKLMLKESTQEEYMAEAKAFVAKCYGCNDLDSSKK